MPEAEAIEEQEDIIDDDSPDDKLHKLSASQGISKLVLDRRKPLQEQTQRRVVTASQEKPITASQRFLAVGKAAAKEASTQTTTSTKCRDRRPWAEKYGPTSLEELMVHKKKVADVRGWLDGVLLGREGKVWLMDTLNKVLADGQEETPDIERPRGSWQDSYSLSTG